jgi:hypothetical protein
MKDLLFQCLGLEFFPGSLPAEARANELALIASHGQAIDRLLESGDVETFLGQTELVLAQSSQGQSIDDYILVAEQNFELWLGTI